MNKEQLRHELDKFEDAVNEQLLINSMSNFDVSYYLEEVKVSVTRQFASLEKQRSYVGASALSRPDVLLGLMYLGYPYISKPYPTKTAMTFHLGDVFEALIVSIMNSYGLKVSDEQLEIVIPGTPVLGHIDGIVESLDAVIEVKTMATSYFKSFVKEPNNFRGYLTQLAIYKNTTGKKNAFWVCFNKETSEIKCVIPDDAVLEQYWQSAQGRAGLLNLFSDINYVLSLDVPDPKPEVFRKEETGKLMLPTSMRYTPYVNAFYDTYEDTDGYKHKKEYVSRVITNQAERLHRVNKIKEELESKYGRIN